jgi:hypothetical protein
MKTASALIQKALIAIDSEAYATREKAIKKPQAGELGAFEPGGRG